jgi:hypothetical protein
MPCIMRSMSILEEMLEMFATTVQAELNTTLHVCESGLQDVLTNRSNCNCMLQALHKQHLVYCVHVMSVGCTRIGVEFHANPGAAS